MSEPVLAGEHVVITRAASQNAPLATAFREAGATVALWPLIEIVPPENGDPLRKAAAGQRGRFDWIVFASANAVNAFFAARDERPLRARLASVGPATSAALDRLGQPVSLEATVNTGAGLASSLRPRLSADSRVLVPRAADARPELVAGLRESGASIEAVVAYRKRVPKTSTESAASLLVGEIGWITFTSARIVRGFDSLAEEFGSRSLRFKAVSIGPTTSAELRRIGVEPSEAVTPTPEGMVAAVAASLREDPGSGRLPGRDV